MVTEPYTLINGDKEKNANTISSSTFNQNI